MLFFEEKRCEEDQVQYHAMSTEASLSALDSRNEGLTTEEAQLRLARYGRNELAEKRRVSALMMFAGQFTDFMIVVLIAAAVIAGFIGEVSDTIAILVIVVLNAVLGFVQEYRAEQAMEALRKMAAASAVVLRDGMPGPLPAAELVPGDIVLLDSGRIVPADMRILESARLSVEEAALTGESVAIEKQAAFIAEEQASLGDRRNTLYRGTFITYGRGRAVVTDTGMRTQLGRIAAMLQSAEEGKTPLQKRLAAFGTKLSYAVLVVCAVIFAGGIYRGEDAVTVFLVAVSLAVAAIPEALPAVVTIALAMGARTMVKLNALVRKLPSVETLGSVTYICTDKTGTLTQNRMTVEEVWCLEQRHGDGETRGAGADASSPRPGVAASPRQLFLTALALSNDAQLDASGKAVGDPTEIALFSFARSQGFDKQRLQELMPRVAELPFDSDRKLMTTFHRVPAEGAGMGVLPGDARSHPFISFTKGAVEAVLDRSDAMATSGGRSKLERARITALADRLAAEGLRVLAVAVREWSELPGLGHDEGEERLTFLGLAGIIDPPREEARESVLVCRRAGIVPVMITGDHPLTASAIARRVGILADGDTGAAVITGVELAALPLAEFERRVESIRVYARVAPEQKLTIVRALQDRGHYVAMTGDGVNDAPALKAADIGVSMGITGTDVAKEASSMILLDDNFATIVRAVKEGRRIYDNIRKFVKYLLSTNSGEVWILFLAPFFGLPTPLQPIHILWINLLTDGVPALALSLEREEGDLMARPPRRPDESIFAHGLGVHAIWVGLLMAVVVLSLQYWTIRSGDAHWQTMVFTVLCFLQLGHVLAIRSERESLFTQGLFSNPTLAAGVGLMIALQLVTVYVPGLNPVFKTQPLSAIELATVLTLSCVLFLAVELEKYIRRRKP